jgi:hypothetical protein
MYNLSSVAALLHEGLPFFDVELLLCVFNNLIGCAIHLKIMLYQLREIIPSLLHRCHYVIYFRLPFLYQVVMEDLSPTLKVIDDVYLSVLIVLIQHKF